MAVTQSSSEPVLNREPSNYTADFGVSQKVRDNAIPSEMIGDCIKHGDVESRSTVNPFHITLRYEEGPHHIELRVDLEANEVFGLSSSYENDWQDDQ